MSTQSKNEKSVSAETPPQPETKRVRYAVIGLGHIAQSQILPAFAKTKNSELAALVSGDAKKLQQLKKKYSVEKTCSYDDVEECLADPNIEAVFIATPNDQHYRFACLAAEAGKHILCEKPLGGSVEEAMAIAAVAREHGVALMTAYRLHFEPATLSAIELVQDEKIGDPRYFNALFSYRLTDRSNIRLQEERAGGPLLDIGIYCLNAARSFFQDEPKEVSAFMSRAPGTDFEEVEETVSALLRFPQGKLASFTVSFTGSDVSRLQVVGTKGSLVMEPAFEYSEPLKQVLKIKGKSETKNFPLTDQFAGEIEAFSAALLEGKTVEPDGEEGIADLRVIEALFESAATGRAVRLPPFQRRQRPSRRQTRLISPRRREAKLVDVRSPHD